MLIDCLIEGVGCKIDYLMKFWKIVCEICVQELGDGDLYTLSSQ